MSPAIALAPTIGGDSSQRMRVTLGPELERFVLNQVKKGQYKTPDQVVRGAVQA